MDREKAFVIIFASIFVISILLSIVLDAEELYEIAKECDVYTECDKELCWFKHQSTMENAERYKNCKEYPELVR